MPDVEERCKEHAYRIDMLSKKFEEVLNDSHKKDLQLANITSDITHIRGRIDEGMSKTISGLDKKFDTLTDKIQMEIMPAIKQSEFWVEKIRWIFIVVFGVGLMRVIWEFADEMIRKLING